MKLLHYLIRKYYHHIKEKKIGKRVTYKRFVLKSYIEKKQYYIDVVNRICASIDHNRCDSIESNNKKKLDEYAVLSLNGDSLGKVLTRNGHIYRGVYKDRTPFFEKLWETGILQALGEYGLMPKTIITDYCTEDFALVIEHEFVQVSKSKMWNYEMIKDACICVLIVQEVLKRNGYKLHDGHLNNVTFHNGQAMFTDIGSIVEDDNNYIGQNAELLFSGVYKLVAWNVNNSILKRIQIYDEQNNQIWIENRFYDDFTVEYRALLKCFLTYHFFMSSPILFAFIIKMFFFYDLRPEYIDLIYSTNKIKNNSMPYGKDIEIIIKMLLSNSIDFKSVSDIGGNSGELLLRMSKIFADKRYSYLSYSDNDCETAYTLFRENKCTINTFLFNYVYGTDDLSLDTIRSDLVVGVDLLNNNSIFQKWNVDSLLYSLSRLSNEYVCFTIHESNINIGYIKKQFGYIFCDMKIMEFNVDNDMMYVFLGKKNE